jgi:hypothetical protein
MSKKTSKSPSSPTPNASDPHPGSVSDGTRRDAGETNGTNAGGGAEKSGKRAPPSA